MRIRRSLTALLLLFAVPIAAAPALAADKTAAIDNPMLYDPQLPTQSRVTDFDAQNKPLWLAALARPDAETRRQAADAIGLAASQGMLDLADTAGAIAATLDADTRPIVRQSCVQALYRLNAGNFAANVLQHDNDDWQTTLIADAALAYWKYEPARAIWRGRIADARASDMVVRSALIAIGRCDPDAADIPPVQAIALEPARTQALRMDAASVLDHAAGGDLTSVAKSLESSTKLADRLVSATMLNPSVNTNAAQMLVQLADDPEPTVVAISARKLSSFDPKLLAPLDQKLATSDDYAVRMVAVQTLAGQRSALAVGVLAKMLADPNREIREHARDAMLALSDDALLKSAVSDGAAAMVAGEDWRGIEQAELLLGSTGDQRADDRIIALMADSRGPLRIAAAVAVRRLRIASALPAMAERCAAIEANIKDERTAMLAGKKPTMTDEEFLSLGEEGSQIVQTLGEMDYKPADAMLRTLIPKILGFPGSMRQGAIWALGRFHAGTPDAALVSAFVDRATDRNIMMPEAQNVQLMSIQAIGMMHAKDAIPAIQNIIKTAGSGPFTITCNWSIAQINGTPMPPVAPEHFTEHGYFLEAAH